MPKNSLKKGFVIAADPGQHSGQISIWDRKSHVPGQIPSRKLLELEVLRSAEEEPQPMRAELLTAYTDPVLRPAKIVSNLGLPIQQELQWARFLEDATVSARNEVSLRHSLFQKFQDDRTPPDLRNAIFQRAMSYARTSLRKSVEVVTPDELRERFVVYEDKLRKSHEERPPELEISEQMLKAIQKAGLSGIAFDDLEDLGDYDSVRESLTAACDSGDVIYKHGRYYVGRKE